MDVKESTKKQTHSSVIEAMKSYHFPYDQSYNEFHPCSLIFHEKLLVGHFINSHRQLCTVKAKTYLKRHIIYGTVEGYDEGVRPILAFRCFGYWLVPAFLGATDRTVFLFLKELKTKIVSKSIHTRNLFRSKL